MQDGGYAQPSLLGLASDKEKDDDDEDHSVAPRHQGSARRIAQQNAQNSHFQQLVDEIASVGPPQGENARLLSLYKEVQTISQDFVEAASYYGHVIISELHVPAAAKTIKPSNEMGGVLGGQKFLVNNILFKCPEARVFAEYPDPMWRP